MKTASGKGRVALALVFLAAAGLGVSLAQTQKATQTEPFDDLNRPRAAAESVPKVVAMESTIDPKSYIVGPSDVFSVNIWSVPLQSYTLTVTPEGSLIVPTVGEVRVADITLWEAKERILSQVRKRYLSGESSATLVLPRSVIVTVSGNVLNPGSYTLEANNRIDKAIEAANKIQGRQTQEQLDLLLPTVSQRNVLVRRKDGTAQRVDIPRFRESRDDRWNPYIREGDVVVVPKVRLDRNTFGVYGEVNAPGRFEIAEGDSLRSAIRMAYGFTAHALTDSVEIASLSVDAGKMSSRFFDGTALLEGRIPNAAVSPGDRIIVRARPELRADYRVSVTGEVRYPGIYPITSGRTRLSEVIAMAGGFTANASLQTAELIRQSVGPGGMALERLESRRGGIGAEDSSYYSLETELRLEKEIVNVDFERLFQRGDSSQDAILRDGDVVRVPGTEQSLYVFGQVVSPGHVPFVRGKNAEYYIQKAGGFTELARQGDVRVIKRRTRQWLKVGETEPEAGDYIWIPKESERTFEDYMAIFGQTAAIVSVALSVVILALQIGK